MNIEKWKEQIAKAKSLTGVQFNKTIPPIPRIPTGSPIFDAVTMGGLPKGKITEIFGAPKSGKSTFAWLVMLENTLYAEKPLHCLYINKEGRVDPVWLSSLGLPLVREPSGDFAFGYNDGGTLRPFGDADGDYITVMTADTGEAVLEVIKMAIGVFDLIVLDSIAMTMPATIMDQKLDKATRVGAHASLLTLALQQIVPLMESAGTKTTLLVINQIRDNIGATMGPKTHSPGGNALKHSLALQIEVAAKKDLYADKDFTVYDGMDLRMMVRMTSVSIPRGSSFHVFVQKLAPTLYGFNKALEIFYVASKLKAFVTKDGSPAQTTGGNVGFIHPSTGEIVMLGRGEKAIVEALSNPDIYQPFEQYVRALVMQGRAIEPDAEETETEAEDADE